MCSVIISPQMIDEADDLLLDSVRAFVDAHGGVISSVGGVELVNVSHRHFALLVHCEGFAPPLPGAPADG